MDKLKMHTPNRADENYRKLAELFPNAVTETINENGEVVRAIDKDVLMQEISCTVVDGNEERYQFTWPDKKKSVLLANAPIAKTLRPCREESVGKDGTPGGFDSENLYIEGDNLEVLKLLQETYLGKIKMIYIDPPYNTGNDFVYEDDFAQSTEEYLANSGQFDEEGNRLVKNLDSNGRFHTDWLNMIYPRLKLAKDLLSDDGAIFISIDDNEQTNTKKLFDEIFGETNKVAEFIVIRAEGGGMAKQVIKGHDYLYVYAKNITSFIPLGKPKDIRGKIIEKDGEKYWIQEDWLRKEFGKYGNCHYEEILEYKGQEKLDEINRGIAKGDYILIPKANGMNIVGKLRNIKEDSSKFYSVLKHLSANGIKDLQSLHMEKYFSYPKPVSLVQELVAGMTIFTSKKGDVVLDFFSGSATTAQAVMQLNAEDGGNRKFIMVQWPEITYDGKKETYKDKNGEEKERYIIDEETNYPVIVKDSEARKAGYWTITQIGKERIRRAGQKIQQERLEAIGLSKHEWDQTCYYVEHKEECDRLGHLPDEYFAKEHPPIDTGFRVLKCDTSNMKDVYYAPADYEVDLFDRATDNIKEDRTSEDLLFQVMLDLGVELSSKIEETVIAGKKVFDVADGFLIACFDADVTDETIKTIAQKQPYYFVMRDSSLANDSVATNFEQIFATYSPDTVRKVL